MRDLEQEYQDAIKELSKCEKQMLSAIYNNDAQQIFPLLDETQKIVNDVLLGSTPPDKVLFDMYARDAICCAAAVFAAECEWPMDVV